MKQFINDCKEEVAKYLNTHIEDVFVVWSCKTLQNKKALLSARKKGAEYFEFTYNGDKNETYVDVYTKKDHYVKK